MDEMTVKELKRVLDLVSEDYVVHVEGRSIGVVELRERKHSSLERTGPAKENFAHLSTKGTVNLIPDERVAGPLAQQDSATAS